MRLIRQMAATSAVIAALAAAPAEAQQTRAQIAAEQRLAKVKDVKPITKNKVEDVLFQIRDDFKIERLFNPRKGFFVRFGVPGEGSGFGGGPAWRISNPGEKYSFTVSAAATFTGNWIGEAVFRLPHLADERFFVEAAF